MGFRDAINQKPWLGWVFSGALLIAGGVLYYRSQHGSNDMFSSDRMTDIVTIKFTDTGDEIEMPRGRLFKELIGRGKLDGTQGIQNPKTGAFTGFPFDKKEWDGMIEQMAAQKTAIQAEQAKSGGKAIAPAPRAPVAPPAQTAPPASPTPPK